MIQVNDMRGDMVLSAILRSDLAPIPYTFEGTIRTTQQVAGDFKDGKVITVNGSNFRIMKSVPVSNAGGGVPGAEPFSGVHVTAFPDGLQELALPRKNASIFENVSLAGAYRSCGANVPMNGDFTLDHFACAAGEIPTYAIARALQEQSAVAMWRKGTVTAMSLRDLFAQAPIDSLDVSNAESVASAALVASQVPVFYSVDPSGQVITGTRKDASQKLAFVPRKTLAQLNAMGRVLVRRKVITGTVNLTIRAGEVINVAGTPMAVQTVAQVAKNGGDGSAPEQYTRVWLGVLS